MIFIFTCESDRSRLRIKQRSPSLCSFTKDERIFFTSLESSKIYYYTICIHPFLCLWLRKYCGHSFHIEWKFLIGSAVVCIRSVYFLKDRSQPVDLTSIIHAERMREPLASQPTNYPDRYFNWNEYDISHLRGEWESIDGWIYWVLHKYQVNGYWEVLQQIGRPCVKELINIV